MANRLTARQSLSLWKDEAKNSYFFGRPASEIRQSRGLTRPAWRIADRSSVSVPCALLVENAHALHVGCIGFFVRVSDREHAELAELR